MTSKHIMMAFLLAVNIAIFLYPSIFQIGPRMLEKLHVLYVIAKSSGQPRMPA